MAQHHERVSIAQACIDLVRDGCTLLPDSTERCQIIEAPDGSAVILNGDLDGPVPRSVYQHLLKRRPSNPNQQILE